jgi:hypothetical protein
VILCLPFAFYCHVSVRKRIVYDFPYSVFLVMIVLFFCDINFSSWEIVDKFLLHYLIHS